MTTATINELTPARYRGLPVTVIGFADQDLLAIAGSGTPDAVAIAILRHDQGGYRLGSDPTVHPTLSTAATTAARMRELRDPDPVR